MHMFIWKNHLFSVKDEAQILTRQVLYSFLSSRSLIK